MSALKLIKYVLVVAASAGLHASTSQVDTLVAISVIADVRHPSYLPVPVDTVLVFGERVVPLRVDVANYTSTDIWVGSFDKSWRNDLSVTVQRLDAISGTEVAQLAEVLPRERAPRSRLTPRERLSARFQLANRSGAVLPVGKYRVTARLNPSALSSSAQALRNLLTRELTVEVRRPETRDEQVEQMLQMAYEANKDGRSDEVRLWATRALALNADSVPALNDMGRSFIQEGDCTRGAPLLQRAITLLQSGGDATMNRAPHAREEIAESLRQLLLTHCER